MEKKSKNQNPKIPNPKSRRCEWERKIVSVPTWAIRLEQEPSVEPCSNAAEERGGRFKGLCGGHNASLFVRINYWFWATKASW
jgi:hypothetical protein